MTKESEGMGTELPKFLNKPKWPGRTEADAEVEKPRLDLNTIEILNGTIKYRVISIRWSENRIKISIGVKESSLSGVQGTQSALTHDHPQIIMKHASFFKLLTSGQANHHFRHHSQQLMFEIKLPNISIKDATEYINSLKSDSNKPKS